MTEQTSDRNFMHTIITGDESWVYGYDPEPVIFLTLKIRQQNLAQMLLAINWHYWQAGKNSCMCMKVQGPLLQACFIEIHQVFAKKKSLDTFLTDLVCALKFNYWLRQIIFFTLPEKWILQINLMGRFMLWILLNI